MRDSKVTEISNLPEIPLTKRELADFRSLHTSKGRNELGCFLGEGTRLVDTFLDQEYPAKLVLFSSALSPWLLQKAVSLKIPLQKVPASQLERLSTQQTPQEVCGIWKKSINHTPAQPWNTGLSLVLDRVQDPGNMGTIIRLADWFGISNLVLTSGCTDPFSPKVVQASMGSLTKVHLHFEDDVKAFFGRIKLESPEVKIWTADLGGNHPCFPSPTPSFLVLGNEGSGISPSIRDLADASITIPGAEFRAAESLNVAASAAILLADWFRKKSNSKDE